MKILFIDDVCPKPYDETSLEKDVIGGTEATTIRIAKGLREKGHLVHVKTRLPPSDPKKHPWFNHHDPDFQPDIVVILRLAFQLATYRPRFPQAQFYLWHHDLIDYRCLVDEKIIRSTRAKVICVSNYHRLQAKSVYCSHPHDSLEVYTIYNPIDDHLVPDATLVDPKKLIFFSQPSKGLAHTLKVFEKLKKLHPEFTLYVARPGYSQDYPHLPDHVVNLRGLRFQEILQHVRSSLAVFYLNHVLAETFGLVLAESNAVGSPVITHPLGAAPEVLNNPEQLINVLEEPQVIERILSWSNGHRPVVTCKEAFRLKQVLLDWENRFLEDLRSQR